MKRVNASFFTKLDVVFLITVIKSCRAVGSQNFRMLIRSSYFNRMMVTCVTVEMLKIPGTAGIKTSSKDCWLRKNY